MELMAGQTLAKELESSASPPNLSRVREIMEALLPGLELAHSRGLVHCDLKPENLFFEEGAQLRCRLIDFTTPDPQACKGEVAVGTPEYMAPEQIECSTEPDARSDIYALGVILFELLTLRVPFGGSKAEIELGQCTLRPPRPSDLAQVPTALDDIVLKCLTKEKERRFQSVSELGAALKLAFEGLSSVALPAPSAEIAAVVIPAVTSPAKAAAPPASAKERAMVLFMSGAQANKLKDTLQLYDGDLAHSDGDRLVAAFVAKPGRDVPVRRAIQAARAISDRGLCERVLVDVATLIVKKVRDRTFLFSSRFSKEDSYPSKSDPVSVQITQDARQMVPWNIDLAPIAGRSDRFALTESDTGAEDNTAISPIERPLIGRDADVESLVAGAEAAIRDRAPTLATVISPPGFGKSHLRVTLLRQLRKRLPEVRIVDMRAPAETDNNGERTLRNLLKWTLALPETALADTGAQLLIDRLGPEMGQAAFTSVALTLGWISAEDPRVRSLQAAPGILRSMVATATGEALRRQALERPLCVLLDDAHGVESPVLDAIEYATLGDSELPLWICVLGRPALESTRAKWGSRAKKHHRIELGPLDRESAATLCRLLLKPAEYVHDSVVQRLIQRAELVPLLLVELVGGLKRDGFVRKRDQGAWFVATEALDELPDSPLVQWLAGRELERLPANQAMYARLASLLPMEFTAAEVEGLVFAMDRADRASGFSLDPMWALAELAHAGVFVKHRDGSFGFRNALVRDAVANAVDDKLRALVHQVAFNFYRSASDMADSVRLPRLAHFAARAGAHPESATAYLTLAESSRMRHAYLEAELLYSRALEQLEGSVEDRRMYALKRRGDARYRVGRYDDSLHDFSQARKMAESKGDSVILTDILLDEALALDWMQEFAQSKQLVERATEVATAHPFPTDNPAGQLVAARLSLLRGCSAWRFGEALETIRLCEEATRQARQFGDEAYEVQVGALLVLSCLYPSFDRLDDASAVFDQLQALCEAKHDERHLAAILINRGYLWIAKDEPLRLSADLDQAVVYSRRLACAPLEEHSQINLANYLYWVGEFEAATPHVQRIIELQEGHLGENVRPQGRLLLARVLWSKGDETGARSTVDAIREQQQHARAAGNGVALLLPSEQVHFDMLDLALAQGSESDWQALLERGEKATVGAELAEIYEIRGRVALRNDAREFARAAWVRALQITAGVPASMRRRIKVELDELPPTSPVVTVSKALK